MDKDKIWSNILDKIKSELDSLAYQTWFQDTELFKIENGVAIIIVPYEINKKIIFNNYKDLVDNCFKEITGNYYELELLLQEETEIKPSIVESVNNIEKDDNVYEIGSNLLSKYTFENFVVGNSNKFAQAAALAVAESPGKIYNPLFIYGNSGLGKTHLMHAIGNYIVSHSNKKVLYITSEQFISDFIGITKKDEVAYEKQKYYRISLCILRFFSGIRRLCLVGFSSGGNRNRVVLRSCLDHNRVFFSNGGNYHIYTACQTS